MKKNYRNQIKSIQNETNNPAIIQDVVDTEIGVLPEQVDGVKSDTLGEVEESVIRNTVDGKTWNEVR